MPVPQREGFIAVEGGRVWYRVVGSGPDTPLLLLHGGAGVNHFYLKPMAGIAADRRVIFYDQLGGGKSDRPTDTTLWRMERFVDEIGRVREALGLSEVHLYGHSFGARLAVAYMATKPKGVRSLILAGPALTLSRFQRDRDSLMRTLPDSVYSVMVRHERDQTTDAPEYVKARQIFLNHFHARRLPWSVDLDSAVALNNPAIAGYMRRGRPPGDWTSHLADIAVPTLFTVGRYDSSTPAAGRYYQSLVPGAELVVFEQSAHLTMHDEPEHYNAVLRAFLRKVDRAR
ncbi:MAG TPA: proline iminopeptidase-family hydrolase [Gemmatimonadaceae bacterium]|nr:proline iminopeptidase-family hydrolase [Gemmatimonadaceae bacterium]